MGVKRLDYPSKITSKILKKVFKGKEGKALIKDIQTYLRTGNPPTGPAFAAARDMLAASPGYLNQAIGQQQSVMPAYQQSVQNALAGNFYDIGPQQAYAERQLHQQTLPAISQTFASLGTPLSSDTTGQITGAVRDTYLNLAADQALKNYDAQLAMATGGVGQYQQAAASPFNLATQGAGAMSDLDAAFRAVEQSGQPGAATLYPSFISSIDPASQIVSRGRIMAEVEE